MKYIKTFERSKYLNPNKKYDNKFNVGDYVKIKEHSNNKDVFKIKHISIHYTKPTYSGPIFYFEYKLHYLDNIPLIFWVNEKFLEKATPEEIEISEIDRTTRKYNI